MAQVKSVFIDGLPPYWDEGRVTDRFKTYGLIERVVLALNMSSAKRNDFGFVNFSTHEASLACIEATNKTELGDDGKSKLKVRVRLLNPLPKSQAVKGGLSGGFRIGYSGSVFNKPGRGFIRRRSAPRRAGFHGGRGFTNHPLGRGWRFISAVNDNSFFAGRMTSVLKPHPLISEPGRLLYFERIDGNLHQEGMAHLIEGGGEDIST